MAFTDILPDPNHKINLAGQADVAGVGGPGYAEVSVSSKEQMSQARYNSQRYESQPALYHTWEIKISYNPLTCEEFHTIFAFVEFKRSGLKPFYVSVPPYDAQTLIGITLDAAGTRKDETLEVDGTGVTPGMIFNVAGSSKVYKVTRVETNTLNNDPVNVGKERLHITPPLIEDVAVSTVLNFVDVVFKVDQLGDNSSYKLNSDGLFEYSLSLEETY